MELLFLLVLCGLLLFIATVVISWYFAGGRDAMAVNNLKNKFDSLERYEEILKQARVKLLEIFTEKEMALIIDVLNGTLFSEPISIHMVYGEVGDGINMDALDQKWEVDGKALVEKVRNLDYAEKVALVDAVERWWNSTG